MMIFVNIAKQIRRNIGLYSFAVFILGIFVSRMYSLPMLGFLIPFALLLMLFPAFLDVDRDQLSCVAARPLPFIMALIFNILISPMLMYGLTELMRGDSNTGLTVGLLIFGMIPAGGMGPAYTGMLKGNINLSITISAVSLFLCLGAVPFWSWIVLDKVVTVPLILITEYIFIIILLPMISAIVFKYWVTYRFGVLAFNKTKRVLRDFSVFGLLMMMFIIPVMNGKLILDSSGLILDLIIPAMSFSLLLLIMATIAGLAFRFSFADRIALTIGATTKNTAIAMALATSVFTGQEALSIAVAGPLVQLPVMLCYLSILARFSVWKKNTYKIERCE